MAASSAAALFEQDVHPRLLFGPDDIPAWRNRAQRGGPGRALAEMLRRCRRYAETWRSPISCGRIVRA